MENQGIEGRVEREAGREEEGEREKGVNSVWGRTGGMDGGRVKGKKG